MGFDLVKTDKKEFILDIFFPNRCPFCGNVIVWNLYCCGQCFEKAGWLDSLGMDICSRCGRYVCVCETEDIKYDHCFSAGTYENELIKSAVLALKYKHSENAARIFARRLSGILRSEGLAEYDLIVPVPMNRIKQSQRGANHAELFAEALSEELHIPVHRFLLKKKYSFRHQHNRNREDRIRSVMTEYIPNEGRSLNGEKILLCDDIMTTGSTINRCAELLKEMGASEITAVVCAETI